MWNRIPDGVRAEIIDLTLEETTLSPRELAVKFTDTKGYFVSEASAYRLLKSHDLITSPTFVVIKADDEFRDKAHVVHKPRLLSDSGSSYISGDLENQIDDFVDHYNNHRYHESIGNSTYNECKERVRPA